MTYTHNLEATLAATLGKLQGMEERAIRYLKEADHYLRAKAEGRTIISMFFTVEEATSVRMYLRAVLGEDHAAVQLLDR